MKDIVRFLTRMLVLNIVLVPIMVLGPLFYVIPLFYIAANPQDNFSGLAQLYFWLGPLSAAFWMLVSCHWPTVRRAQREGRLATWRESEGGIVCTVLKAFVYMVLGLLGSFVFEITFVVVFRFRPGNPYRDMLWFTILPFATFAPVILLWLSRRMRGRKQGDFISRTKNDRELRDQLRAASLYARNLRNRNAPCPQEEG
ncbi:MAG: hypothetical protein WAN65_14800 [Candidatus Sulfotelmatobacter sp.]